VVTEAISECFILKMKDRWKHKDRWPVLAEDVVSLGVASLAMVLHSKYFYLFIDGYLQGLLGFIWLLVNKFFSTQIYQKYPYINAY